MRRELVLRSHRGEQVLVAGPVKSADDARRWLDQAFVDFDCEPVRASGKVLTLDKVLAVARAAGPGELEDAQWTAEFAAMALAALGKDAVSLDLDDGAVK